MCREESETLQHVFFRRPDIMGRRLRRFDAIFSSPEKICEDWEVATLAATGRALHSHSATLQ